MTTPDIRSWLDRFGSGQLLLGAMARPHTHIFAITHISSRFALHQDITASNRKNITADTLFIRARMLSLGLLHAAEAAIAARDLMG